MTGRELKQFLTLTLEIPGAGCLEFNEEDDLSSGRHGGVLIK